MAKATPSPPLSAKGPTIKPKSSGKKHKTKSNNQQQERHSNLSSPYAFTLSTTPPGATPAKQGIPLGQSVLVVTIKDKTVKVHMPTDSAPRSPTLLECKAIIKHQQETNKRQEQEVSLCSSKKKRVQSCQLVFYNTLSFETLSPLWYFMLRVMNVLVSCIVLNFH